MVANVGVLLAAGGVWLTGTAWPDLLVGVFVAVAFLRSPWAIVRAAWPQFSRSEPDPPRHENSGGVTAPLELVMPVEPRAPYKKSGHS